MPAERTAYLSARSCGLLFDFGVSVSAIDVKFWMYLKTYHTHIISIFFEKFTYWQDMFSPYQESFTPVFCAEAPETESVN